MELWEYCGVCVCVCDRERQKESVWGGGLAMEHEALERGKSHLGSILGCICVQGKGSCLDIGRR